MAVYWIMIKPDLESGTLAWTEKKKLFLPLSEPDPVLVGSMETDSGVIFLDFPLKLNR